jgi:hypothetical protein
MPPVDINQLIQQHLPQDLWPVAKNYTIGEQFFQSLPDLIELILRSKSIDLPEEKQNRFNLLNLMNEEQVGKLRDILTREKQKLEEIEKKYEEKKLEIKKKYLLRRQSMGYIKKVNEVKQQEAQNTQQDQQEADNLLAQI